MTRLVFVTQAADPDDPVLGATLGKIRALAARVDELVVIADRIVPGALPDNCRGATFAAPTQTLRGSRYVAALTRALVPRPRAIVAHMAPVYALLAAPLARPLRIPVLLWFTQQGSGPLLDAAVRVADRVLTVDERTVPVASRKVFAIGHGIDVQALTCVAERRPPLRRLLGLGRYAPVKGWDTVLRALTELPESTLTLHGPMLTAQDREHRPQLERLAVELGVRERVAFRDAVEYAEVPRLFAETDAVVNATRGNAADKVVYEAAASCLPVFAASPVFDRLLPEQLRFEVDRPESLARRIESYASGAGPALRAAVEAQHSVEHWADGVLEAVA